MLRKILSNKNLNLLIELVRTDFKLRYQGSVLGYAWSLLNPLFLFLILYIVFSYFFNLGKGIAHYPVYLLLGIVMWNFFREATSQGMTAIVARGGLIRKIKIPRWILVLSSSISALINLALNMIVVGVFLVINKVDVHVSIILLPLLILEVYLFAVGVSLFLSAAYVKFRDINYIWDIIMQAAFYLTPIIYPISRIPKESLQQIIMLNPMAQAIQDARYAVVTHQPTISSVYGGWVYRLIPLAFVVLVFVGGLVYFNRQSKYFAENI